MDYFSLKAAAAEAKTRFSLRKVRETSQVSSREAVLIMENEGTLHFSIDPSRPGLFIFDENLYDGSVSSPFADLLDARIRGAILTSVSMPTPGDRVVFLTFKRGWPARSGEPVSLVLEVMGRHSNLAALHEKRILQPMKAVPREKSPRRPFLSGEIWKPPPLRPGLPPEEVRLENLPAPFPPEAASTLLTTVRGLSPYTARQTLLRAPGGGREAIGDAIEAMLGAADGRHGWLHFVEDKTHLCPFEPMVTPDSRETVEAFTPFSAASAVWKGTKPGDITTHRDETGKLAADLGLMEERLASALARLDHERERCSSHEEVRLMAEALLIHASGIRPGAASVSLPNPYEPEQTLSIKLDPSLSAHETADRLFTDARRMKRGLEELPGRRAPIEKDLSSLENAREALLERGDPGPASNLLGKRFPEPSKGSGTPFRAYKGPGRKHIFEEFTILVGRSASDNEKVTFQAAGPHDLWLHARDYAGSHVVILTKGIKVPEKVIYHAATLAAESSGAKNDSAPEIMITERKWVKKLKGGKPGMVTVERYRTVRPRTRKP